MSEPEARAKAAAATYQILRQRRGTSVLSAMNVTPLVDVVLVLLLVFMVTAPTLNRGMDVSLPTQSASRPDLHGIITVTLRHNGLVLVGEEAVALAELEGRLKKMLEARANKVAYLMAHPDVAYGRVIEVEDRMLRAGVTQVGLAYEQP